MLDFAAVDQIAALVSMPVVLVGVGALVVLLVVRTLAGGPRPRPGEIWYALVPFEDGRAAKDRPVLVLGRDGRKVLVARFTSQDRDRRRDYVRVPPGTPGLSTASWVELRPRALRRRAFRRRTGTPGAGFVHWYDAQVTSASRTSS